MYVPAISVHQLPWGRQQHHPILLHSWLPVLRFHLLLPAPLQHHEADHEPHQRLVLVRLNLLQHRHKFRRDVPVLRKIKTKLIIK